MKYYVTIGADSSLNGRYNSEIHGRIPADAFEVDADLYFQTISEADGIWSMQDGKLVKRPFPCSTPDTALLIADERYRREASGIVVDGLKIATTRDSQALIASTGLSAVLDPKYRCNFKTMAGFVEIGAAQIIEIAKAVRAHVQACFDRELTLLRAVDVGEYSDEMLTEGWPNSAAV